MPVPDPHSASRPDRVTVRSLELDLTVDFDAHRLTGTARWEVERRDPATRPGQLVLDTRDLQILEVTEAPPDGRDRAAEWRLGARDPLRGRALVVRLRPDTATVAVRYRTSSRAGALQWLGPEQTADGAAPFLYTQSQPILARTWVPCQDTPGVRFTWEARVRAPEGLQAVMSADRVDPSPGGVHRFRMDRPVPSYLLALAVGRLEFRELSPRSGVWAEPSLLDAAAREFARTDDMMRIAESICGPYRWGRYDILVLPPSFPWGGMENARLTFCTPTILAGDRSLVALIAHELAHAWSGNLVTNATWNDFWLNEGFTTYLEHRIGEQLHGRDRDEMLAVLARDELVAELERLDPEDTSLRLDLSDRDPSDGMTAVPYEKGYFFLRLCEETVGRERWDRFLAAWFERYAFQSVTTDDFLAFLRDELLAGRPDLAREIDVEAWVDGPGLPGNAPRPASRALDRVEDAASRFADGAPPGALDPGAWSAHEWLHFLRRLPRDLSRERLASLDEAFGMTGRRNAEVLAAWLLLAAPAGHPPALERAESFLLEVGRLKLIRPLYERLIAAGPGTRERARAVYRRARAGYHPLAVARLDPLLR